MSEDIRTEEGTSQTPPEDTTSQNVTDAPPEKEEKKTEKPTEKDQQTARAIKAEEKLKEAQEKLKSYEEAETLKKTQEMENKGQYEALMKDLEDKREKYESEITNLGTYKEKYEALETQMVEQAMSKIPEEQKELVEDLTSAYTGQDKIDKINKLVTSFGWKTFGWSPEDVKKTKKSSRIEELRAKRTSWTIAPLELSELKRLEK